MEQTKIQLSDDTSITVEETVSLDNYRLVVMHGDTALLNLLPVEAEALGLALLKMSTVAKVKGLFPKSFGESAQPPIKGRYGGVIERRKTKRGPYRRQSDKTREHVGGRR